MYVSCPWAVALSSQHNRSNQKCIVQNNKYIRLTVQQAKGPAARYLSKHYTFIRLLSSCGYPAADFHRARFPNRMSGCASTYTDIICFRLCGRPSVRRHAQNDFPAIAWATALIIIIIIM